MTPNAESCSAAAPPPPGYGTGTGARQPVGLVVSADAAFSAFVRSQVPAVRRNTVAIHRCDTLAEADKQLRFNEYAYALLDARRQPLHAAENLAAILSIAPRLPVIVCLSESTIKPPDAQLRALGAFEIVTSNSWPDERLTTALRHALWFASANQPDTPPTGSFHEPDRPLLAEVSHEMRSPLNSIIGFAETIEQQALDPWPVEQARYRDYARHIRNSGEHLLALFEDLLQIGDSQTFALAMEDEADPAHILQRVAEMMRAAALEKELSLVLNIQKSTRSFRCNERFLAQALLNLL